MILNLPVLIFWDWDCKVEPVSEFPDIGLSPGLAEGAAVSPVGLEFEVSGVVPFWLSPFPVTVDGVSDDEFPCRRASRLRLIWIFKNI